MLSLYQFTETESVEKKSKQQQQQKKKRNGGCRIGSTGRQEQEDYSFT